MATQRAGQKPARAKPWMKLETNHTRRALIIKVNKPKERMLIGRVKIIKIGRTKALIKPKITATIKAI